MGWLFLDHCLALPGGRIRYYVCTTGMCVCVYTAERQSSRKGKPSLCRGLFEIHSHSPATIFGAKGAEEAAVYCDQGGALVGLLGPKVDQQATVMGLWELGVQYRLWRTRQSLSGRTLCPHILYVQAGPNKKHAKFPLIVADHIF